MQVRSIGVSALVLSLMSLPASAALLVDGNLADWGVTVADHNQSNFSSWASGLQLLGSHTEDQDDEAGHSFVLGPNSGGQDYDAEMIALALQGDRYYICLVTGQRPDNGATFFAPGDLRIETSAGTFGIEFGGGAGGASNAGLIVEGASGTTYRLYGNGNTEELRYTPDAQVAGSIWQNPGWHLDPIAPQGPTQLRTSEDGTYIGLADFAFTRNATTSQHAIIELSFDKSLLGGASLDSLHWRPSCGNDELNITSTLVPEPVTLLFMVSAGIFMLRRRR